MLDNGSPVTRKGFFLVQRKWRDFDIFKSSPFSEPEAWLYLIETAQYADQFRHIDGMRISVKRGQLVASARYLMKAWDWKKDRVLSFLKKLEKHEWVTLSTDYREDPDSYAPKSSQKYNRRPTLITVNHYNELQGKLIEGTNSVPEEFTLTLPTALRQDEDKPNQNQTRKEEIKNPAAWRSKDRSLFELFPNVKDAKDFINHMPSDWQSYPVRELNWDWDWVAIQVEEFWKRYGKSHPKKNLGKPEKRGNWQAVWKRFCTQKFRQPKPS